MLPQQVDEQNPEFSRIYEKRSHSMETCEKFTIVRRIWPIIRDTYMPPRQKTTKNMVVEPLKVLFRSP